MVDFLSTACFPTDNVFTTHLRNIFLMTNPLIIDGKKPQQTQTYAL